MIVLRGFRRAALAVRLAVVFLGQLVAANAVVAWEVVTPTHYMRPGIIRVPLRSRTDLEVTLLANLISLTPGTLSLEVADDHSELFVHGLHVHSPEDLRHQVAKLEDLILAVLR